VRHAFSSWTTIAAVGVGLLAAAKTAAAADEYEYDPVHSSISFKSQHLDISWIHGRFNMAKGKFVIDKKDPAKSSFELSIDANSVDTANQARDEHLRQPDYFDTKQFPTIDFKSTSVKPIKDGYEVTGEFTMHGKTKKVTFNMLGAKETEWMGKKRIGFSAELSVKRSDYGFDKKNIGLIGDEARIFIDCEGAGK
jgi:polyisoprenoid-binding protein YceI